MAVKADLETELRGEVEALHAFLAAWFRGDLPRDKALFHSEFADRLADGMENIQPSGIALSKETLLGAIFEGHGSNGAFEIGIRDFRLLAVSADRGFAVATYVEDQKGAKNTDPPDNTRVSTVVFRLADGDRSVAWLHLHETAAAGPA